MSNLVVNIDGVNFEDANITLVNGLTMEKIRLHYPWLLNAKVKDAIIGEDRNGIIWYFGDWYCGEWETGTWYSGNFFNGQWNDGKWFSYKLNKFDIVNEIFTVIENSKNHSQFHKGVWIKGVWDNGIFGSEYFEDWNSYYPHDFLDTSYTNVTITDFHRYKQQFNTWEFSLDNFDINNNDIYSMKIEIGSETNWYRQDLFNIGETILLTNGEFSDYCKILKKDIDTSDSSNLKLNGLFLEFSSNDKVIELNNIFDSGGTYTSGSTSPNTNFEIFKIYEHYINKGNFIGNVENPMYEEKKDSAIWVDGKWTDGLIQNAVWNNGVFQTGTIFNSNWLNGNFYDGIFNGNTWYNGSWLNGDFIHGKWMNGVFAKLKQDKISRFGATTINNNETNCEWFNGEWKNGEWFSGRQELNGLETSFNNHSSIWYNGLWRNGDWYGGHFKSGKWDFGIWKDGIFGDLHLPFNSTITHTISTFWMNGIFEKGLWLNGEFKDGEFVSGSIISGEFKDGILGKERDEKRDDTIINIIDDVITPTNSVDLFPSL